MESSRPEPDLFELLAQSADSAMPDTSAADLMEAKAFIRRHEDVLL